MTDLPSSLAGKAAGTNRISSEVLKEHQRDRVIEASIGVFAKEGYSGTTVDDIVLAAKVGVGNFYSLLGGKDECFRAALERAASILREGLPSMPGSSADLAAGLQELLKTLDANPKAARLILVEARRADQKSRERYGELAGELAKLLRSNRSPSDSYPADLEFGLVAGAGAAISESLEAGEEVEALFEPIGRFCLGPYLGAKELERVVGKGAS